MTPIRRIAALSAAVLLTACHDSSLPTAPMPPAPAPSVGDVRTGWIVGPGGEPIEVSYEVIDGLSIHEGDINLGAAGTVPETREELFRRPDGPLYGVIVNASGSHPTNRWPGGVVPYVISPFFTSAQQQVINDAMSHIANLTGGTQFVPRTSQSQYVSFELHSSGCNSEIGRQSSAQAINLTSGCVDSMGIVAHEIAHALGMWHEQSRCDRDNFITVHSPYDQDANNFGKKCSGNTDVFAYEEASIMHYSAFSPSGVRWITSKRGLDHLMGQRNGLHQTDVNTINILNQPYPVLGVSVSYPGGTPTIAWNASSGATYYAVNLVIMYEEFNHYENTSVVYEAAEETVGTTTGLTLSDTQNTYTGRNRCYIYNDQWGSASYAYYYRIWAVFPGSIVSQPADLRPVDIAPEYPC